MRKYISVIYAAQPWRTVKAAPADRNAPSLPTHAPKKVLLQALQRRNFKKLVIKHFITIITMKRMGYARTSFKLEE